MASLPKGSFELDGHLIADSERVAVTKFYPGTAEWNTQAAQNRAGNNTVFGRETLHAATWSFDFVALRTEPDEAIADMSGLAAEWLDGDYEPGEESVLRFNLEGQTRMVYGRPRQFSFNPTDARSKGALIAGADFAPSSPFQYDADQRLKTLRLAPSSSGGLMSPLTSPLTSVIGGERQGFVEEVGGTAPAPFTATFFGPISNPSLVAQDWEITFDVSLAYDESLTVDTRSATAVTNRGASKAGKLSRKSRLSKARLKPGSAAFKFYGRDETGTSSVDIRWHPTYYSF